MGDLHLDIILNRIRDEYKIDASIGRLQVAYREAPTKSVDITGMEGKQGEKFVLIILFKTLLVSHIYKFLLIPQLCMLTNAMSARYNPLVSLSNDCSVAQVLYPCIPMLQPSPRFVYPGC